MLQGSQQEDQSAPTSRNRQVTLEARARRAYNKIKKAEGRVLVYFASGRLATAGEGSSMFEYILAATKSSRLVGVFDYRVMQRDFYAAVEATARELAATGQVDGEG